MLVIVRDSTYADRLRAYSIWADDERIGKIRDGEIKRFNVSPGKHTLHLQIDWARSKSLTFELNDSKDVLFQCLSSVSGKGLFSKGLSVYSKATVGYRQYITLNRIATINPAALTRIDYRQSHPIPKNNALKVLILSVAPLVVLPCAIFINNLTFNPLSHGCVADYSQQGQNDLANLGIISPGEAMQKRLFCKNGYHPELKRGWMLGDEVLIALLIGVIAPIFMSSSIIYVLRALKSQSDPMLQL